MIGVARVHFELPDELHRRAKAAAAMAGQTLKAFITQALEAAVEETERERRVGGAEPADE